MAKILNTQNAQITTVSVEIKSLTVSSKQVTQSVFRQLLTEQLITMDGTLAGVPWGHVNYHPDKCADSSRAHLHVVWQSGSELRRCRVNLAASFDVYNSDDREFAPEMSSEFYTECVRTFLHTGDTPYFVQSPVRYRTGYAGARSPQGERVIDHRGVPLWLEMSKAALSAMDAQEEALRAREEAKTSAYYQDRVLPQKEQKFADALAALDAESVGKPPLADLFSLVDEQVIAEAARRQRYRDSIAAVTALPHLFIAV